MAGDSSGGVRVEGLAELRKALKDIDPELQKHLRARFVPLGKQIVERVRARMPVGPAGRGHHPGQARESVSSGVSGNTGYVQESKKKARYIGWLDYGGTLKPTGRRRNTIVRVRQPKGRYLYPVVLAMRPEIVAAARQALADTKAELGLSDQ